jgi:hypothetical protein
MKRVLCTVAALAVATAAFAGTDLTPQQAWDKMINCPVCSAWNQDPALGPTLRYDVQQTKSGFVEIFQTSNEAMKPAFDKAEAECERRAATIPTMSAADKSKLCPFCTAHAMIDRKDVSIEDVQTSLGFVHVGTSTSPDGIKALHDYAAACKKQSDLIQQASMEMQKKSVQKAKM